MLVNFGYFLSVGLLNPVMPRFIVGPLHSNQLGVGIGVSAFTVTALALRQFSGRFGDRRGRHYLIRIGAVVNIFSVGGLVFATTLWHVVLLRLATGVVEAFIFVGVATAIQDISPDDRRGEAASLFSLSLFVALAVGPVIGEFLLDHFSYDAVFLFGAGAAAFGTLWSFTLPDTRTNDSEPAGGQPFFHRAAVRPGLILACAIWGLAAFNSYMPLYAINTLHMRGAGTVFLANSLTILLFRSFGARLPDRFGALPTARFSLVCTPLGLAVMAFWAQPMGLYVGAVLLAVGQSMAFPALMTVAINSAPSNERGSVMGTFTAFFDISFGGGALALGAIARSIGYNGLFGVATAVASIGLLQILFAPPKVPVVTTSHRVFEIQPPGE